jgi:hypothetical protein
MKKFLVLTLLFLNQLSFANVQKHEAIGEYGIHLFFNEQEFIDVLTLQPQNDDSLSGIMYVPNDFEGEISDLKIDELKIQFDLFVPKNSSRPEDLIFQYEGEFFDKSYNQMKGFVTLKNEKEFIASFLGFKRNPETP